MQKIIKLMEDSFTEEEISAVNTCLRSGNYTQGKIVEEFEAKFASWNNSKYAIFVNSGSSANLLMAFMLREYYHLQEGDEVIVPCVTWPTTVYPLIQYGLTPVFCDVDASFNLDPLSLKRMVSKKTKAVFLVHLLGQPAKLDDIFSLCRKYNLLLLEDTCESLGATYLSKKVGTFGEMSSFSFYFGHHMTTIEGGMITTDNSQLYDLLKSARSHGWVRGSPRSDKYPLIQNKDFLFDMLGYNLRSTNLNASIGLVQLRKLDSFIQQRVKNHRYFLLKIQPLLQKYSLDTQQVNLSETSSFSLALLFHSPEARDYVLSNLEKYHIESRPIVAGNLLRQPVFEKFSLRKDSCPFSDVIHTRGIYLPNNQFITSKDIDHMVSSIIHLLEKYSSR